MSRCLSRCRVQHELVHRAGKSITHAAAEAAYDRGLKRSSFTCIGYIMDDMINISRYTFVSCPIVHWSQLVVAVLLCVVDRYNVQERRVRSRTIKCNMLFWLDMRMPNRIISDWIGAFRSRLSKLAFGFNYVLLSCGLVRRYTLCPEKRHPFYFWNNSVKNKPISIFFSYTDSWGNMTL